MGHSYHQKDDCVCTTVKKIVDAQNEVAERQSHRCLTSCEQSIKQLTSPRNNTQQKTTIPFILYCKQSCQPFIASGVFKQPIDGFPNEIYYDCIETPILRAKKFVKGTKCCVVVELLRPVNANGIPVADSGEKLCDFFSHKGPFKTIQFRETGICLTLDLKDFSTIVCLDPVNPLPKYKGKKHHSHHCKHHCRKKCHCHCHHSHQSS